MAVATCQPPIAHFSNNELCVVSRQNKSTQTCKVVSFFFLLPRLSIFDQIITFYLFRAGKAKRAGLCGGGSDYAQELKVHILVQVFRLFCQQSSSLG